MVKIDKTEFGFIGYFNAMASPCECLIETENYQTALAITQIAADEAWRIEKKYSRYLKNNVCAQINQSNGAAIAIDQETFKLLDFANTCYEISNGLFDLTSGVLRRVWHFNQNTELPSQKSVEELLPLIGWNLVSFDQKSVCLAPGTEIDFGGIGKEYAVDVAVQKIKEYKPDLSVVVNFGGDLRVTKKPKNKPKWNIGIDSLLISKIEHSVSIGVGAVCTSGDTEKFILSNERRYSHILNPKTGWPAEGCPKTVTIIADQCLQAGVLATLGMLMGAEAEAFLTQQNVQFHCQR